MVAERNERPKREKIRSYNSQYPWINRIQSTTQILLQSDMDKYNKIMKTLKYSL